MTQRKCTWFFSSIKSLNVLLLACVKDISLVVEIWNHRQIYITAIFVFVEELMSCWNVVAFQLDQFSFHYLFFFSVKYFLHQSQVIPSCTSVDKLHTLIVLCPCLLVAYIEIEEASASYIADANFYLSIRIPWCQTERDFQTMLKLIHYQLHCLYMTWKWRRSCFRQSAFWQTLGSKIMRECKKILFPCAMYKFF